MDEIIQSVAPIRPLKDPVLITGFMVQRRGGRLASTFLTQLSQEWHAELIAKISGDAFYDFTVLRPLTRRSENRSVIDWPDVELFLANKEGSSRDLLLLIGSEPHYHWRAFSDAVIEYAGNLGVRLLVNLRSFAAAVPHTRPAPIYPESSDAELAAQFGPPREKFNFEGPTDIAEVVGAHAQSLGWQTVDLSTMQPFYFRPMPRAEASIAWIKSLDGAFGGTTSLLQFEEAAADEARAVDEMIGGNLQMQTVLRELEQKYDSGEIWTKSEPGQESNELPSGEDVADEIERLFREGGMSGGSTE